MNACRTCGMFGYSHLTGGWEGGQAEYVRVPFGMFVWSFNITLLLALQQCFAIHLYFVCLCFYDSALGWRAPSGDFCWSSLDSTLKMISILFELNWNKLLDSFFVFHRYEKPLKLSFLLLFYYKLSFKRLIISLHCKTSFSINFCMFRYYS